MKGLAAQLKALEKGLQQFKESTRNRIVRGGVTKGLRRLAKGIKGKVPPNFKDVKKAIGQRLEKGLKAKISGKVGAGVGIKAKRKEAMASKRQKRREGHPGVGIGPENVHWFILGTDQRKHEGTGASTGRMPAQVPDIVKSGMASARGEAFTAMYGHIRAGIKKEQEKLDAKIRAAMQGP